MVIILYQTSGILLMKLNVTWPVDQFNTMSPYSRIKVIPCSKVKGDPSNLAAGRAPLFLGYNVCTKQLDAAIKNPVQRRLTFRLPDKET